jgi:hypothetical protein
MLPSDSHPPLPPPLPPGWCGVVDPDSGKTYYHHSASETATWDLPGPAKRKGHSSDGGDAKRSRTNGARGDSSDGRQADEYGSHSLAQLKDACRAKGLPVGGTKVVLRQRLEAPEAPVPTYTPLAPQSRRGACPKVRKVCPHNRQQSRCKECGGSSFCEHGRQKRECKECGGSAFCEHGW